MQWRPSADSDSIVINEIASVIWPHWPERPEVLDEKRRLFRDGSKVLMRHDGLLVGYGISHPWKLLDVPPLDSFLNDLPQEPDCIFIHDGAILPSARGNGHAGRFVDLIAEIALAEGIGSLALMSICDSYRVWSKYGFKAMRIAALADILKRFGDDASYMILKFFIALAVCVAEAFVDLLWLGRGNSYRVRKKPPHGKSK